MSHAFRTALAVLAGIVTGGAVNMALVVLGPALIAPPPGADTATVEGLKAAMPLMEPRHFLMPFLAHAAGTFVGALLAALIAGPRRAVAAWVVGAFFLIGGIMASVMIPAPAWFIALDLAGAYLPMAWLALTIATLMARGR